VLETKTMKEVTMEPFDLTSSEFSPAGKVVGHLHYHGILECLLHDDEYSGSPSEGGSHFLRLHISRPDLEAFLDLIEEYYATAGERFAGGVAALRKKVA